MSNPQKTMHPFNQTVRYPLEIVEWIDITAHERCSPYCSPNNVTFVTFGAVVNEFEHRGKKIVRIMFTWEKSVSSENSEYLDIPMDNILSRTRVGYMEAKNYEDIIFQAHTGRKSTSCNE